MGETEHSSTATARPALGGRRAAGTTTPGLYNHRRTLEWLATRAQAGEDGEKLSHELYAELLPWLERRISTLIGWTRSESAREELRSAMLLGAWEAVRAIDWSRWQSWPQLLEMRLRGARADALRQLDHLRRRDRRARKRWLQRVDAERVRLGRELTMAERRDLARADFDEDDLRLRPELLEDTDEALRPVSVPAGWEGIAPGETPEESAVRAAQIEAVQEHLRTLTSAQRWQLLDSVERNALSIRQLVELRARFAEKGLAKAS